MPVDEDESAVMISDSTNLLIKDTYFTAPQTVKVQTRVHEHWKEEIVHGYALLGNAIASCRIGRKVLKDSPRLQ